MSFAVLSVVVAGLVALVWLSLTEFSYLPGNLVRRVYDRVAGGYERKWKVAAYSSPSTEMDLFVAPLRRALGSGDDARLLDLACGTGRIPLMVLRQSWFHGTIHAVDFSAGMLQRFTKSIDSLELTDRDRVAIEQANLADWPVPAMETFDAVSFMEASELLSDCEALIAKIVTVLKPEGLLLLTKPSEAIAWLYFGRKLTNRQIQAVLKRHGFGSIKILPWRWRYSVIHAWKLAMP